MSLNLWAYLVSHLKCTLSLNDQQSAKINGIILKEGAENTYLMSVSTHEIDQAY